jgi:hypothetical protein
MRAIRCHLTYANVMASVAVFVALGGGAYAMTALPKNSVGTKQLKQGAVTSAKLHSGAVTSAKLGPNVVTGSKIANGSITGAKVLSSTLGTVPSATNATNAVNATNAATATNATQLGGKAAANYISSVLVRSKDLNPMADGTVVGGAGDGGANDGNVFCASGERAIAGGVRIPTSTKDQAIVSSRPIDASGNVPADGTPAGGWRGLAADQGTDGGGPTTVTVYVICAS